MFNHTTIFSHNIIVFIIKHHKNVTNIILSKRKIKGMKKINNILYKFTKGKEKVRLKTVLPLGIS
jgi:hypothetical protein